MLTTWNYEDSVKRVSAKVSEWKAVTLKKATLTDEIARELYEAREQLSDRGSWSVVPNGTTVKGWREYLNDVGLAKSTVHRWLEHFDPEEQRLLTDEEHQRKENQKKRQQMEKTRAINHMVDQRITTGHMPDDWNDEAEKKYQDAIERMRIDREWKEKIKREAEERKERVRPSSDGIRSILDDFSESILKINEHTAKRQTFKEKIRLSQSGESDAFIDALLDYLDELDGDSRRIEACNNIIKVVRNIAAQLHHKGATA
jgi:hypothetical protein